MKPKSLSERQRVQLRERFNALWKQLPADIAKYYSEWPLDGHMAKTACWMVLLAHVQTSRSTPEKRRRAMEAGCVEAMK